MKPKGKRHNTIPIELGGQHSAGDPTVLPPGFVSLLRNYVIRPSRLDGRAPFVYDSLDAVSGFAIWQDMANELQKTVATCSADNKLYTKNASGTGYGTGLAGLTASTRLTSYTNILGKLYMAFDNGAGVPTAMAVYDGTSLSMTPFNSAINARSVTSYIGRNFLIDPRATIKNWIFAAAYGLFWTASSSTVIVRTVASGKTTARVTPTALTGAWMQAGVGLSSAEVSATKDNHLVWRCDLRGTSADVPVRLVARIGKSYSTLTAYLVGDLVHAFPENGLLYRVKVAGTSGAGAPIFPTTPASTVVDGTVTWEMFDTDVTNSVDVIVPDVTREPNWRAYYLPINFPAVPNGMPVDIRIYFGNTATPTLTSFTPIDFAYMDGLTDGTVGKRNYGQQITIGDFYYPFFNQESTDTGSANIDAVIWSEIENPAQILARNTYPLTEIAGLATAAIVSNGRYVVFKRSGTWIFKGTSDPYEPILPESPAIQVGCLGPRALDCSRDNVLYWIGEGHVYKMAIGSDAGPTEIDSPGMFEEMFSRTSSTWVESQSTYNMPLLAIDHANKDVWVYTQKGHIHIYSIQTGLWSYLDTNPTGTSAEVRAMIFDPASNRMLVSFGGAAATRFDETSNAQDTIVTGGGTAWNITNDIVPRPFELFAARYEASLLEVGVFHLATLQNGSLSIRYSYDRGVTYTTPDGYPVTSWIGNPRIRLPLAATGESVTIKISRTGAGGARNWSISKADALLRVHRGELTKTNAT